VKWPIFQGDRTGRRSSGPYGIAWLLQLTAELREIADGEGGQGRAGEAMAGPTEAAGGFDLSGQSCAIETVAELPILSGWEP